MDQIPGARFVQVNGLHTFYVQRGNGQPLVLVHGGSPGACTLVNWGPNLDALAASGFAVYAFDQPGFGYSECPADYSIEYRVHHAKAFIDQLGLGRFHLIGNSQGSYIAARVALENERVDKLVLVSSGTLAPPGSAEAVAQSHAHAESLASYEPSLESMRRLSLQTLRRPELVTEEFVQLRYAMSIGERHKAAERRKKEPRARPITEHLPRLRPPTLLLCGRHDHGVALERMLLLFQVLPDVELHIFSESGHWVQWDQADRFNTLVVDFLR